VKCAWNSSRRGALALGLGGLASLVLGACQTNVTRTVWPEMTFGHKPSIPLAVSGVQVIDAAPMSAVQPPASDIRHALPISVPATVRGWATQRLLAMGGSGTALVTILENRFVEVPLDTKQGVEGLFTTDQSERYEGALALRVEVAGDPAGAGFAEARVSASRTVPENFSINQREQALYDMLAGMMRNLDERLEQEMRANLARWIMIG